MASALTQLLAVCVLLLVLGDSAFAQTCEQKQTSCQKQTCSASYAALNCLEQISDCPSMTSSIASQRQALDAYCNGAGMVTFSVLTPLMTLALAVL